MDLSPSDIRLIACFARRATKAGNVEAVINAAFETLREIAGIRQLRLVYGPEPAVWSEWKAGPGGIELCAHEEWPTPSSRGITVLFDPENDRAGYVSANGTGKRLNATLEILAPEVWSALLLQAALRRVQKGSLSETELVRLTLRAREEERRHIARELHDDLGQSMASLKLTLKWAEDLARGVTGMQDVVKELSAARVDVGTMIEKIRDLSHTLYPRILDTLGLTAAIQELGHRLSSRSDITVMCTSRGKVRKLQKDTSVALYRCCQEAVSNALRHSGASKLNIAVAFTTSEVRVSVQDDGKGFNPRTLYDSNSRMMSSGFWTIRQRMADLRGSFRVSTAEGQGTVVEMTVPFSSTTLYATRKDKTLHRG